MRKRRGLWGNGQERDNLKGPFTHEDPCSDLASAGKNASRFSTISVTMAPLNELTGEVMNTTMDEDSFGTLLMDDPGDDDLHAGLWWTDVDCAMRSYVHDCGG